VVDITDSYSMLNNVDVSGRRINSGDEVDYTDYIGVTPRTRMVADRHRLAAYHNC